MGQLQKILIAGCAVLTWLALAPVAAAAETEAEAEAEADGNGIAFRFGLGPGTAPRYFGDDQPESGPDWKFQMERLVIGSLDISPSASRGPRFGGSVGYIGGRKAAEIARLAGLDDLPPSFEIGGGFGYATTRSDVVVRLRYGAWGHRALVADLAADYKLVDGQAFGLKLGPRLKLAEDGFAQTYFGISPEESSRSGLAAFAPRGGVISAGAEFEMSYELTSDWSLYSKLTYGRFVGDAAASPITAADDQVTAFVALARRFSVGF